MVEASFTEEYVEEQFVEYKPLSGAALVGFLFLLVGSAAPFLSVLLWFDLLAVSLAIIALFAIRKRDLTGKTLAIFTLFAGMFFIGLVPAMAVVRRQHLHAQAIEKAEQWFDLFRQEKFYDAHQLTEFYSERRPPAESYEEYYEPPDVSWVLDPDNAAQLEEMKGPGPYEAYVQLFSQEPYSWLKSAGKNLKVRCLGITQVRRMQAGTTRIKIEFEMERNGGSKFLVVTMQRDVMAESGGQTHWQVQNVMERD